MIIILAGSSWSLFIKSMIAIVIIAALSAFVKKITPKIKGAAGEATVALVLKKLDPNNYIILNNVMLDTSGVDGASIRTSQIDHVIVSKYGVFSIETKNYKGWITGSENGNEWTQTIYKTKNKFKNPIRQNYGHVKALKALIKEDIPIYPIVAFPGDSTLKVSVEKSDVVYWGQLVSTIKKYSTDEVLSVEQMNQVADLIREHNIDSEENRKEHVREIKDESARRQEALATGICPRCGGKLVERSGKYGKFFGCSNYPGCKFTQKK